MEFMPNLSEPGSDQEFYRIRKLPPYVFAVINAMKAKARAAGQDVIDLGMGNPDGATPRIIVNKMIEAARNPRNHRYSQSKGIPKLREEMVKQGLLRCRPGSGCGGHCHDRSEGRVGAPAIRGGGAG